MSKLLVTGSSSGIGAAVTRCLLAQGKTVIGVCRRHTYVDENYQGYSVDLTKTRELDLIFKAIAAEHSDLDGIICCAGYGQFVSLEQFSFAQMQSMMQVNFLSQALLIKCLLPQLKRRRETKIIAIGSECALSGYKKGTMYCASKYALRGFMASLRQECRQANVAVSMIHSGMVDTEFFDNLDFCPGDDRENKIDVQQIVAMVKLILSMDNRCVIEEINCQPMKNVIQSHLSRPEP